MNRIPFLLSLALVAGGCATSMPASTPAQANAQAQAQAQAQARINRAGTNCSVLVYRMNTSYDSLNHDKPHLFVGEEKVSTLGVGESVCLQLPTGKHIIAMKASILFMPAYTIGQVEVDVSPNTTPVYIRYARAFTGVALVGSTAAITGKSSLAIATKEQWAARE